MTHPWQLTPFEEYFLLNDRPSHPAAFCVRLDFSGTLDRQALQEALGRVIEQHPLADSSVGSDKRGRPYWQPSSQSIEIDWIVEPDPQRPFPVMPNGLSYCDIRNQPPLRICVLSQQTRHQLRVQVHHAAFDGMGMLQFLEQWWSMYEERLERGATTAVNRHGSLPDVQLLKTRCRSSLSFWQRIKTLPGQWKTLRVLPRILRREVKTISATTTIDGSSDPSRRLRLATLALTRGQTEQLGRIAVNNQTTVNNLLAEGLFCALQQWHSKRPDTSGSHWRVMIPINERLPMHRLMPGCNHCTMISLDRSPTDIADRATLRDSIRHEMGVIRRWKLSLNFWRLLRLMRHLPGGLEKQISSDSMQASTFLTNLGNLQPFANHFGHAPTDPDSGMKGFAITVPLQPGMAAGFAASFLDGCLQISMTWDAGQLNPQAAEALLHQLEVELTRGGERAPHAWPTETELAPPTAKSLARS